MSLYSNDLKKHLCQLICIDHTSTIQTAHDFSVPLKTLEKWITAYNKNPLCFDAHPNDFHLVASLNSSLPYDQLSSQDLLDLLMKKDIEIARLKKGYFVRGGGTVKKEFIIFSTKNTK